MASSDTALEVNQLCYSFKNHRALGGVTFSVAAGTIHGFVGPNGAGKTTTLKIGATLLRPQLGTVHVFGLDVVRSVKQVRRRIGFMPDHFSLYRQMTVFEYLDFFAAAYGQPVAQRNRTIHDVLALTDMDGRRNDLIKGLSRGMQQRVSLARVLVHDPEFLLLDEPASGLDPRARIELMAILRELQRLGKTIFISSHILSELADLCDSVTIIDRGRIKFTGRMSELLSQKTNTYELVLAEPSASAEAVLRDVAGVTDVAVDDGRPRYTVSFDAESTSAATVLRTVLDNGLEVTGFNRVQKHLNQAFMDLTEPGVPS